VIAVDTRGQGKSTEDGKTYTYDLFAEDMNALLDHLKLDSVNIVGWSDGGNTGLIMAMKYPAKVRRLVTMGAVIFIDHTVVDRWVFRILDKRLEEMKGDSSYYSNKSRRLTNLLLTEPRHSFDELKSITCPVLVMAGQKDIVREEHTRGIAAHISGAVLYIAPGEKHEFPTDNAKAFNEHVLEFLRQ
jgi:pimeloyl-ACP methyl ester carboxylesterase